VKLTFAELEFVLRDDPTWPKVRSAWGCGEEDPTEEALAHGVASLLARDLARISDGEYLLESAVGDLARRLTTRSTIIQVAGLTGGEVSLATYLLGDGHRTMVLPVAPGVVAIDSLRTQEAPATQLAALVTAALDARDGRYVIRVPQEAGWVSVTGTKAGGVWTCDGVESSSAAEFAELLERTLRALPLPEPRAA
jgi:hypothetical protein